MIWDRSRTFWADDTEMKVSVRMAAIVNIAKRLIISIQSLNLRRGTVTVSVM